MNKLSRRSLAGWASNQIKSGQSLSGVINKLAAVLIVSRRENKEGMLADDVEDQ